MIVSKVTFTPCLAAFIAWEQGLNSLTLSYPGVRSISRTPNHSKLSQQSVHRKGLKQPAALNDPDSSSPCHSLLPIRTLQPCHPEPAVQTPTAGAGPRRNLYRSLSRKPHPSPPSRTPAPHLETTSGRISIFNILIKSSPGNWK